MQTELIEAEDKILRPEIQLLIYIRIKEELPEQWNESITLLIYKKGNNTDHSNYRVM
jgi:hypothetical protein